MENASQALIIAGTILIALIVLSIGVYLVSTYSVVGESYDQSKESAELVKFNSRFTAFEGRDDITAQEIVTLYNYVISYNKGNNPDDPDINFVPPSPTLIGNQVEFLKENAPDDYGNPIYFKCMGEGCIQYTKGKVSAITFTK